MISILLPNLNGADFLHHRVDSILKQSFTDWEVIVVDGFSTDNSLEIIRKLINNDKRWRIYQEEPRGIYQAWNSCLSNARGDFIYIATSDDTMDDTFLEKMSKALEQNPSCGLAMCAIDFIDQHGESLPKDKNWSSFPAPIHLKSLFARCHVRKAPLDGILSFTLHNIYHSTTQLLVRKSTYDLVGPYRTDLGSGADFEWSMRVGLSVDCVYLPEKLATWRVHHMQASQGSVGYTSASMIPKMQAIRYSYDFLQKKYPQLSRKVSYADLSLAFRFQQLIYELTENQLFVKKINLLLSKSHRHFRDCIILIPIILFSFGRKEKIRALFTKRNFRMSGVSLRSHLSNYYI